MKHYLTKLSCFLFLYVFCTNTYASSKPSDCKTYLEYLQEYELVKADALDKRITVIPRLLWEEPSDASLDVFHPEWKNLDEQASHYKKSFFIEKRDENLPLFDQLILVSGTLGGNEKHNFWGRYTSENRKIFEAWFEAREIVRQKIASGQHPTTKDLVQINKIVGSGVRPIDYIPSFQTSSHWKDIPAELAKLDAWYEQKRKTLHPVALAALYGQKLLTIHPFDDGNGRTSRLAQEWILVLNHLPPPFYSNRTEGAIARSWNVKSDGSPIKAIRNTTSAVQRALNSFLRLNP